MGKKNFAFYCHSGPRLGTKPKAVGTALGGERMVKRAGNWQIWDLPFVVKREVAGGCGEGEVVIEVHYKKKKKKKKKKKRGCPHWGHLASQRDLQH